MAKTNLVIIDNYDSFTYNLSHLIKELGADVTVYRNDQFQLSQLEEFDKIVLSPGPGIPSEAGLLLDVIKAYAGKKPMLGVCLGHQAIGEAFGGKLTNLSTVFHGVQTPCYKTAADSPIFKGLPTQEAIEKLPPIRGRVGVGLIGRYHSWVVDTDGFPECLEVTALSEEGQVMALQHKTLPIYGIQFHPESVLTPDGKQMLKNFLEV
ncbi:MAG: aminodeoxychorismate/anthranilate synthase component II [Bacteroidaceae bacterium]|nr:aminodeoxychorismate/anthranilate synthase component II [Bacteroidaceae bacterium]